MNKLTLSKVICILFVSCAATAIAAPAQVFTVLHSFDGSDGAGPSAALVQATDGNFYGTTPAGGTGNCSGYPFNGCGTVFQITPSGTLTTIYSFCAQSGCPEGAGPVAGLVQATDGNFYGTTEGTVFKITPSGTLTTLYSFNGSDGSGANGLVQASDGNFYGTTGGGGANGYGTVFKITPSGTLTTLHSFAGYPGDGATPPAAGFIQATDGNFYGATTEGGANNNCYGKRGCGSVFKVTPGGAVTILYSFCSQQNCPDGYYPRAGLMQASDGNFYGTTVFGAGGNCDNGCGTLYKITPSGTLTTLYSFGGYPNDPGNPEAVLVQAGDGNFYGTTYRGGADNNCDPLGGVEGCGTVFKMTPSGTLTTLHSFNSTDGWGLDSGLIQARDGNFYGTTAYGGAYGYGTIFRLVLPRPCVVCPSVK